MGISHDNSSCRVCVSRPGLGLGLSRFVVVLRRFLSKYWYTSDLGRIFPGISRYGSFKKNTVALSIKLYLFEQYSPFCLFRLNNNIESYCIITQLQHNRCHWVAKKNPRHTCIIIAPFSIRYVSCELPRGETDGWRRTRVGGRRQRAHVVMWLDGSIDSEW